MLVEAMVVGRRGAAVEPREIAAPTGTALRLRDLIAHLVHEEVAGFNDRERQRRLIRVLTRDEIEHGAARGKVDAGGRQATGPADADHAVEVALEAFEDGLYFVFVDDQQIASLDDAVAVSTDTRVRFVRLVALAGGC